MGDVESNAAERWVAQLLDVDVVRWTMFDMDGLALQNDSSSSHDRRISFPWRCESGHPGVCKRLNQIGPQNVFAELFLLNKIQSL